MLLLLLFTVAVSNTIIVRHYFRCVVTMEKITAANEPEEREEQCQMLLGCHSSILSSTYGNDSKHYNTVATVESGFPKMAYILPCSGRARGETVVPLLLGTILLENN